MPRSGREHPVPCREGSDEDGRRAVGRATRTPPHMRTILFRGGLNAKQVQLWLGHHSLAFTLSTYVHLLPDDIAEIDFLDALIAARPVEVVESEPELVAGEA